MNDRKPLTFKKLSPAALRLARQVPQIYLSKNEAVPGKPLWALLEVFAQPLQELEAAVTQLADDHFVERAGPEALKLLAELVGARWTGDAEAVLRGIVARTVHWRRRKGTLVTLEEVIETTTGWSGEADEAFRSLLHNQDLANPVTWRGRNAVVWDPIALADPLSRRAPQVEHPRRNPIQRAPELSRRLDETVEAALRRLGRADAGRHAASPRNIDLSGWARPEIAVIRTSRFVQQELDRLTVPAQALDHQTGSPGFLRLILDPAGRDRCLVGRREMVSPEATGGLTAAHEPNTTLPVSKPKYDLLTPTDLAADGDAAEQDDNLTVFVDGVRLVGQKAPPVDRRPVEILPVGSDPVLRFTDSQRPAPGEHWLLELVAVDNPDALDFDAKVPADFNAASAAVQNTVLERIEVRKGTAGLRPAVSVLANLPRGGSRAAIRLSRPQRPGGYRLEADGTWTSVTLNPPRGHPLSPALVITDDAASAARLERLPGDTQTLVVSSLALDGSSENWFTAEIDWSGVPAAAQPLRRFERPGPAFAAAVWNAAMLIVGPAADGNGLWVWQITDPLGAQPLAGRIDGAGSVSPSNRFSAAVCVWQNHLYLFGGETDTVVLGDFWSMPLSGPDRGQWRGHRIRNRQQRSAADLIPTDDGLVLLGGAASPGTLDPSVWRLDLQRARWTWSPLASLPLVEGQPGVLWARFDDGDIETLVWPNRLRPQRLRRPAAAADWQPVEIDPAGSPNPPACGELVFAQNRWHVLGPPPLPPSEVLFTQGSEGVIAFLPEVDLIQTDQWVMFAVLADGSTERMLPPGETAYASLRSGAGRHASAIERSAPQPRIGAPGRLKWSPFKLRQRSLGPWNHPLALTLDDTVALDPRLGRVLLPAEIAPHAVQVSYRIARAAPLGAGFLPADRVHPAYWREPEAQLQPDSPLEQKNMPVTAWVDPARADTTLAGDTPVVAAPRQGIIGSGPHLLAIAGSPRFENARLSIAEGEVLSLFAADAGGYPHFASDTGDAQGISLSLLERLFEGSGPQKGPAYYLSGLSLQGRLALVLTAGHIELRWCDFAAPGCLGVSVAGSGHQSDLARRSIPQSTLTIWLYGCIVGRLEVPPWVRVIAAGCLFDGGPLGAPAISALGAPVRLRHCTVRGDTLAGELQASSSAFQGEVWCDRPDRSWLRYSLLPDGPRLPLLYECRLHPVSFAADQPTDPNYLVLADNNGPQALLAGEERRLPGAHAGLTASYNELELRTREYLPMGMTARQIDRSVADRNRMSRMEDL